MGGRWIVVLATAALLGASEQASSQPATLSPPPSPAQAEEIAKLYVEAVNDEAGLRPYLARDVQEVPPAALENWFSDQRWISGGGMELIGAHLRPGGHILELALRSRLYGGVQGMELTLADGDHPKVTAFEPTPAPAWSMEPTAHISERKLATEVERLARKGCAADRFSGAVLVAKGARVLVQTACGEASRRYHVRNTPMTLFNIGSMDKMFTAVAAMQLVEAGKISLNASVDRYLDESWLNREAARRVTVWQLLTHTSGLSPDVVDKLEDEPRERFRELTNYKRLVQSARPKFEPGSQFDYSNTGMLLLGAIVAEVSGQDYYAYVRQHVFQPAAMTSTGSYAADEPVEKMAVGYSRAPSSRYGWRENTVVNMLRGMPAGGGYSTVGDLHRFAVALKSGKLLSKASLQRLWDDADHNNYAAGFETGEGAIGRVVGHSGLFYGVSTRMRLYPDSGYVVVVLSNMDRAAPPLVDALEGQIIRACSSCGVDLVTEAPPQ